MILLILFIIFMVLALISYAPPVRERWPYGYIFLWLSVAVFALAAFPGLRGAF